MPTPVCHGYYRAEGTCQLAHGRASTSPVGCSFETGSTGPVSPARVEGPPQRGPRTRPAIGPPLSVLRSALAGPRCAFPCALGPSRWARLPPACSYVSAKELARAGGLWPIEKCFRGLPLYDDALVNEDDLVGYVSRETHLVCHDDHRHAFLRKRAHYGEHFPYQL